MWLPGWIVKHTSSVSCLILGQDGHFFKRHQDHMWPRQDSELPVSDLSVTELPVVDSQSDDATLGATLAVLSQSESTFYNSIQPCRHSHVIHNATGVPLIVTIQNFEDRSFVYDLIIVL